MKKLMLLGGIRYPLPVIKAFPTENQIRYTLCIKLSWSHLRLIMRVGDPQARKYYLEEASRCGWGVRDPFFRNEEIREKVYNTPHEYNVFTRCYFYPLLTDFAPYIYGRGSCPIAEDLGKRVLTLPTYCGLKAEEATTIAEMIKEIVK